MNPSEQIDAFARDLDALVSRYCAEFELSTAAAIGVLEIKKHQLIAYAIMEKDGDDEE